MDLDRIIKLCHMLHLFWLLEPWMCRCLSNDYFNYSLLYGDILQLPILSMPTGSRYYDVTAVEQMSICGWK